MMGAPPESLQRPFPPRKIQAGSPSWLPAVWEAPWAHLSILDLSPWLQSQRRQGQATSLGRECTVADSEHLPSQPAF